MGIRRGYGWLSDLEKKGRVKIDAADERAGDTIP